MLNEGDGERAYYSSIRHYEAQGGNRVVCDAFLFFKKRRDRKSEEVRISGGDGTSLENAVVIHASSTMEGIAAEKAFISTRHGARNQGWKLAKQSLLHEDFRPFDVLEIILDDGREMTYYFDVSAFFGRS